MVAGGIRTHAPFSELADVGRIKAAYLDDRGGIVGCDRGPLYPEGSFELERPRNQLAGYPVSSVGRGTSELAAAASAVPAASAEYVAP